MIYKMTCIKSQTTINDFAILEKKTSVKKNPHFFVWEQALFDYQIFWQEFGILGKMVA